MKTLLQMVNAVADELGLPRVTTAISTDQQSRQIVSLLNREGRELAEHCGPLDGWPILRREHSISVTSGDSDYALPSDLLHFINRTGWDRTRKWELSGPVTPQEWQFLKSGYPATGFLYRYRIMADELHLDPEPSSSSTVVIEYYTNQWAEDSGGTGIAEMTADDDVPRLIDHLLILGTKWRFLNAKGFGAQDEYKTYRNAVDRAIARAAMARTLNMSRSPGSLHLIDHHNIPDTGFGT